MRFECLSKESSGAGATFDIRNRSPSLSNITSTFKALLSLIIIISNLAHLHSYDTSYLTLQVYDQL